MTIRVLSLNCWGGRLCSPLLQYLRSADADVYCLQEVYTAPPLTPRSLVFGRRFGELPIRPHLFDEIAAVLPGYHGYFSPAVQGFLKDCIGTKYYGVLGGLSTFVRRTLPVMEQRSAFVYGKFRPNIFGPPPISRTAHCVRVYHDETGLPVTIAHMHGLWIPEGKMDTDDRRRQAEDLCDLVQSIADPLTEKAVVCGDFNVLPDSYTFAKLRSLSFGELVTRGGVVDTRTSYYTKEQRAADYLCVSASVQVIDFHVVDKPEVSDHRPLLLDLR